MFNFEMMARRLIEGSFKRLFGGQLEPLEIGVYLARALEDSQRDGQAATHYVVFLAPQEFSAVLQAYPGLADELGLYVQELALSVELTLPGAPQVSFAADAQLRPQMVRVEARHVVGPKPDTTQLHPIAAGGDAAAERALREIDAYLIVSGRQHVALDKPVVSIGRRMDNDVVLDSPTVSRQHAQIRWRYGRFILYDLSNRGRTAVNGAPTVEHVLQPGDVIGLSNVMLIYGEGKTGPLPASRQQRNESENTQIMPNPNHES